MADALDANGDHLGGRLDLQDVDADIQEQPHLLEIPEQRGIIIGNLGDPIPLAHLGLGQGYASRRRHQTIHGGYRSPMRIAGRTTEERVHPPDGLFGHRMFPAFGLGMDLIPGKTKYVQQKELDQTVPA